MLDNAEVSQGGLAAFVGRAFFHRIPEVRYLKRHSHFRRRNCFKNSFLMARFKIPYIIGLIQELQADENTAKECQNEGTESPIIPCTIFTTEIELQETRNATTAA